MRAILAGRFDEADEMIRDAEAFGARSQGDDPLVASRVQRFLLSELRGTLVASTDSVGSVRSWIDEHPTRAVFRCLAARAAAIAGRRTEAAVLFQTIARDDFGGIPTDNDTPSRCAWCRTCDVPPRCAPHAQSTRWAQPHAGRIAVDVPRRCRFIQEHRDLEHAPRSLRRRACATDAEADRAAAAERAHAFALGRDIYFAAGQYAPETMEGATRIAHGVCSARRRTSRATWGWRSWLVRSARIWMRSAVRGSAKCCRERPAWSLRRFLGGKAPADRARLHTFRLKDPKGLNYLSPLLRDPTARRWP
jgi:hypothetical protein